MLATFQSTTKIEGKTCDQTSDLELKDEAMFFQSSPAFVFNNGSSLTRHILHDMMDAGINVDLNNDVIDTRITLCQKGFCPSIPGWHCDNVPRPNGQPDISLVSDSVRHYMVIVSDKKGHSCTEFLRDSIQLEINPANVWASVDDEVNKLKPRTFFVEEGQILSFSQLDIHRATPATCSGWRLFFRLTHGLNKEPVNEIRKQVQIYVPQNAGW